MIPPFDDSGWLPPGVYPATLHEIEQRFGRQSELREVQMESVRWMVELAKRAGVERIILNGSFITDRIEPNDVDCVLLLTRVPPDRGAADQLKEGLPFLEMSIVDQAEFDRLVNTLFAFNRRREPKGMVEVIL